MSEWHLSPDYIVNNWTDELFALMVDKLVERKAGRESREPPGTQKVSPEELFRVMGKNVKVVKGK